MPCLRRKLRTPCSSGTTQNQALKQALKQWLSDLSEKTGIRGELFVRHAEGKTTFMETYENVGCEALEAIEGSAAEQACFKSVQRRCEVFERVHTKEHPNE